MLGPKLYKPNRGKTKLPKFRSTNDPKPATLTPDVLEAVKTSLRIFHSGDHDPALPLHLDGLKKEVKSQGVAASGDQLVLALKELVSDGLIKAESSIGVWHINWISPKI
jgi:hypothetical protein